jgi:hypothetical protein
MATDGCFVEKTQDQLAGNPMFVQHTDLLTTNPVQKNYGIAVTDIDADGTFEFVVAGYGAANQAFKWDATTGNFKDVALEKPALQDTSGMAIGVAACDVDGDGFEELYILNTDSYSGQTTTSDKLVDRDDSGVYEDILAGANHVAGRSCACVDRSGTGRYGVFVANYGGPMRLYEMPEGGREIKDVAPDVGMDKTTGGRALIAGPLVTNRMDVFANNEGWYGGRLLQNASKRRLNYRLNFLFAHDGDGKYTDIAEDVGLLDADNTGRGTAFIDANGDGLLDVVYGNWVGPHRLFIQEKDASTNCPKFVDKAPEDMTIPSKIRTVIVADFDNDGYEEIFWNNIPGANRLFRKLPTDADWVSVKIGDALEEDGLGTGGAVGDFDGDGVLELVVAHGESGNQPLSYFRPTGYEGNHYLRILPLTSHGAPARGAKVSMQAGDRTQVRVIDAGSGYLCQMEPVAHFGLGALTAADSVTITWPDGASHTISNPGIDQMHRVERPADLQPAPYQGQCSPQSTPAPTEQKSTESPTSPASSPKPQSTHAPTSEMSGADTSPPANQPASSSPSSSALDAIPSNTGNGASATLTQEVSTQLVETVQAGATSLPVATTAGFEVGRQVQVAVGTAKEEVNTIAGFGSLVLVDPLKFDHGPGTTIAMVTEDSPVKNAADVSTQKTGADADLSSSAAPTYSADVPISLAVVSHSFMTKVTCLATLSGLLAGLN